MRSTPFCLYVTTWVRKMALWSCLMVAVHMVHAQQPARMVLKGVVTDSAGAQMVLPTVMLLNPEDSTLLNFTRGDEQGRFVFKNIPNRTYLLKISYLGYIPYQRLIGPFQSEDSDMGKLYLKPLDEALMEVVIRAARAPLSFRGDTVEYDASSFKVPPGSSVEDLLRRLPGIDVDTDGNIKSQGRDVKRVYVDGKTFFGDDPKAATRNLGAEMLTKVQVYNEASEQSRITGIDDGKEVKVMNLELKDEFKKGAFGKATAAAGTRERLAGRASYNRFNERSQLSFIGFGNNINETGVNWEDYSEFKGQGAFNSFDNGDFGFSSGRRVIIIGGGPINNFDGRGFTENFGGGVNYNHNNAKTDLSTNYFYNQTDLNFNEYAQRNNFVQAGVFTNLDTTRQQSFRNRHSMATRVEHKIDSSNTITAKANWAWNNAREERLNSQFFTGEADAPINRLETVSNSSSGQIELNSAAIYKHTFRKKGRVLAWSGGLNTNDNGMEDALGFSNRYFQGDGNPEVFRQSVKEDSRTRQLKSSVLFTEALSERIFLESFFNTSHTRNRAERVVADVGAPGQPRIDSLSMYYDNGVRYNRLGSMMRYAHDGLNLGFGLAAQELLLNGDYARGPGEAPLAEPVRGRFRNLIPNASLSYELGNNLSFDLDYEYNVREPAFADLQPVAIVTNPLFVRQGNPLLGPERMHTIDLGVHYWNPGNMSNFGVSSDFSTYDQQIVYNQTVVFVDSVGVRTTTTPANASGGYGYNTWSWIGMPIVKTKLNLNVNASLSGRRAPSFVNEVQNNTRSNGYNLSASLNLTPSPRLILNAGGNVNTEFVRYDVRPDQNQRIANNGVNAGIKWECFTKTFLESNFRYSAFRNDRTGFNQNIPNWNASVRRLFGPKNKLEARLAAFDLLNRRVNVTQSGTENYVRTSVADTLARYVMLSVSYNVRGFESGLKKRGFW